VLASQKYFRQPFDRVEIGLDDSLMKKTGYTANELLAMLGVMALLEDNMYM
jgi:hypothetical protein